MDTGEGMEGVRAWIYLEFSLVDLFIVDVRRGSRSCSIPFEFLLFLFIVCNSKFKHCANRNEIADLTSAGRTVLQYVLPGSFT